MKKQYKHIIIGIMIIWIVTIVWVVINVFFLLSILNQTKTPVTYTYEQFQQDLESGGLSK